MQKIGRAKYPPMMQYMERKDLPAFMYMKGNDFWNKESSALKYLCVVGSRKYTEYGESVCRHLIAGLAGYPIVIVSGLAIGIDSIAHEAALAAGLRTIAFPGSGLSTNVLYPAQHRELAHNIVEAGGTLLSEYSPEERATPWMFPARNRLMAGASHATLIIEAERKSGTAITTRLALSYNRDVFVVPGSIFSYASEGTHALMAEGAHPIFSAADIVDLLGLPVAPTIC